MAPNAAPLPAHDELGPHAGGHRLAGHQQLLPQVVRQRGGLRRLRLLLHQLLHNCMRISFYLKQNAQLQHGAGRVPGAVGFCVSMYPCPQLAVLHIMQQAWKLHHKKRGSTAAFPSQMLLPHEAASALASSLVNNLIPGQPAEQDM